MGDMTIFNELAEMIAIRISSFKEEDHGRDWVEHKTHNDYDLWFVQSGQAQIRIEGTEYTARAGDVVFFYPRIPYRAAAPADGCRFIYIHFEYGIGAQQAILNDFPLSGIIPHALIRDEALLFAASFGRATGGVPGGRLYLKASLTAAIARIIELHGQDRYTGAFLSGSAPRRSERNLDTLQPIFQYIDDHLHQPIKMSELAALAGISEKYFISYFKKSLGITPGQYLFQVKMNRARDYIYQRKYTVQQIAGFLGYPDPFTFSKAFRKHYHVPPSKFV
ncbi:AraC family transcriptional regulator [Cohnella hashimotonis]|uniref:AraC family transcriptional regulator n=1 Tax=Cohnella hashimotonis TaxID=2826895 RepID=A0ABT6T9X8_9BACL|nr:AraC family transcriptional regulator [Cohnella hashimotonis]MDI4643574.1 AraC family transcriptional regulator [Cohnella hashimotonis]